MKKQFGYLTRRANTTSSWLGNTDSKARYKETTPYGANLYKEGDVEYKFNSDGFRCDEFSAPSDIPIMFVGCSVTEGIGLPIEETWSYKTLEKIRQQTGANIPYWSLGLGGSGIDTTAKSLYWWYRKYNVKPIHVFGEFARPFVRELRLKTPVTKMWQPSGEWRPPGTVQFDKSLSDVFLDKHNILHNTQAQCILIDTLCELMQCKLTWTHWANLDHDIGKLFAEFPNINFINTVEANNLKIIDVGRDSAHPGPATHSAVMELFWPQISHYFK